MIHFVQHVAHNPLLAAMDTPELRLAVFAFGLLCMMFGVCLMTPIDAPEDQ